MTYRPLIAAMFAHVALASVASADAPEATDDATVESEGASDRGALITSPSHQTALALDADAEEPEAEGRLLERRQRFARRTTRAGAIVFVPGHRYSSAPSFETRW